MFQWPALIAIATTLLFFLPASAREIYISPSGTVKGDAYRSDHRCADRKVSISKHTQINDRFLRAQLPDDESHE